MDRQFRLARLWSNREVRKIGALAEGDTVNVSGWKDGDKEGGHYRDYFPKASSYRVTNYTDTKGAQHGKDEIPLDLTAPLPPSLAGAFDTVFNHTTLEHVFEISTAFANLCRMTRDLVIIVVPFAQRQHERPDLQDYWRFTPTCLRRLFAENGLQVVYEAANTGRNAAVYIVMAATKQPARWAGRLPLTPVHDAAWQLGHRQFWDGVVLPGWESFKAWGRRHGLRRPSRPKTGRA